MRPREGEVEARAGDTSPPPLSPPLDDGIDDAAGRQLVSEALDFWAGDSESLAAPRRDLSVGSSTRGGALGAID